MSNPQLYKHKPVFQYTNPNIYSSGTNEETTMFSSILLGALMACNQPATAPEYVPGVLETDGKLIATVNGVQIKDGIVDSLLKDAPEAQRAAIMAGPQFAQLKEQLVTTEVLYQEAVKANIHKDKDAQFMMHLTEREVMTDFLVKNSPKQNSPMKS